MSSNGEENLKGRGNDYVTRDGLYYALSRLELKLVEKLATNEKVENIENRVLTADAIKEIVRQALDDSASRGWSGRERGMGVILFMVTLGTFALNIYALKHGVHGGG